MKAWLWHHLYPMNLWSRCVVYCGSLIKLYNRWIWKPFLENRLSSSSEVAGVHNPQLATHVCVQCRRKVKLALVVCESTGIKLFCSAECEDRWACSAGFEGKTENMQHPTI